MELTEFLFGRSNQILIIESDDVKVKKIIDVLAMKRDTNYKYFIYQSPLDSEHSECDVDTIISTQVNKIYCDIVNSSVFPVETIYVHHFCDATSLTQNLDKIKMLVHVGKPLNITNIIILSEIVDFGTDFSANIDYIVSKISEDINCVIKYYEKYSNFCECVNQINDLKNYGKYAIINNNKNSNHIHLSFCYHWPEEPHMKTIDDFSCDKIITNNEIITSLCI